MQAAALADRILRELDRAMVGEPRTLRVRGALSVLEVDANDDQSGCDQPLISTQWVQLNGDGDDFS